jgi:hypothetical protein
LKLSSIADPLCALDQRVFRPPLIELFTTRRRRGPTAHPQKKSEDADGLHQVRPDNHRPTRRPNSSIAVPRELPGMAADFPWPGHDPVTIPTVELPTRDRRRAGLATAGGAAAGTNLE